MKDMKEFEDFVKLADAYYAAREKAEALEKELNCENARLMPEIHARFSSKNDCIEPRGWVDGCDICRSYAVEAVRDGLNLSMLGEFK